MREFRTTVWGVPTRAIEVSGSGTPVVLLHGFCDSADTWRSVLERLALAGRSAIAYDLPGFGYADRVEQGTLLDQQEGFAAAAIVKAAGPRGEPVLVTGNSLGGWVTLRLAARDDLPIAGIVPIAPAGLSLSPWFYRTDAIPGLDWVLGAPVPLPSGTVRGVVARGFRRLAFGDPAKIDEPAAQRFSFHNRSRAVIRWRLNEARKVRPLLENPIEAGKITVPTTVVWGDRDLLCLPAGAEPLVNSLPNAKLVMLEGCGHCPQLEEPERTVEALLKLG